jgi:hypothetical protein
MFKTTLLIRKFEEAATLLNDPLPIAPTVARLSDDPARQRAQFFSEAQLLGRNKVPNRAAIDP